MASIGQTLAGPRFHETDEVRLATCFSRMLLTSFSCSGLINSVHTWMASNHSCVDW